MRRKVEWWEKHLRRDLWAHSLFHLYKYMCSENLPGLTGEHSHIEFGGRIPCEISKTSFQNYRVPKENLIFQGFALPCLSFPSVPSTSHKVRFNFKLQQHNSSVLFWTTLPDKLPCGDYVLSWLLNVLDKFFGKQTCPVPSNLLWTYTPKKKKRERGKKGVACFPCVQFHLFFSLTCKQITCR